jgi:hypothetical protein
VECLFLNVRILKNCNKPWRPVGFWDVEAPIFCRQHAHRWRWGCQPYAPAALHPQEDSWFSFLLEAESTPGPQSGWKDWVSWKQIQWLHRESKPRPPVSYYSAWADSCTACPLSACVKVEKRVACNKGVTLLGDASRMCRCNLLDM